MGCIVPGAITDFELASVDQKSDLMTIVLDGTTYIDDIDSWMSSGGSQVFTVAASEFNGQPGVVYDIEVLEEVAGDYVLREVDEVRITAAGDVVLTVPNGSTFTGKIVISKASSTGNSFLYGEPNTDAFGNPI